MYRKERLELLIKMLIMLMNVLAFTFNVSFYNLIFFKVNTKKIPGK